MSERLTDNPSLFRLRVRYGKRDRLKYLGHLEVIHTIERIVRRAGLPYAVTQASLRTCAWASLRRYRLVRRRPASGMTCL